MKYAYQRGGAPILSWKTTPPQQSRAGSIRSLGSLGNPTLELPVPGGPEPLAGLGGCGCGGGPVPMQERPLAGDCGCKAKQALHGIADSISELSSVQKVGLGLGAYLLYKHFKKRR